MSWSWPTAGEWLCRSAVGGGLLLLLAWALLRRTRQPARRQRLGECGVGAALVLALLNLGPSWLVFNIPVPAPERSAERSTAAGGDPVKASPPQAPLAAEARPAEPAKVSGPQAPPTAVPPAPVLTQRPAHAEPGSLHAAAALEPLPAPGHTTAAVRSERDALRTGAATLPISMGVVLTWLGVAYALGAAFMAGRWLLGHLALWRLLQQARPAGPALQGLLAELRPGRRRPRLLVSRRLRIPVSCGLWRPTIVLPDSLCTASATLRWVLIHEATHLERRDPWTCLLLGLGQLVYFYLPWFWWLRREVGVCQEFIADAAVAGREERPEDYAEFLLLLTRAPRAPVGATGVAGTPSDLFQRVSMLLRAPIPVETACPALWSCTAVGSLATLALLASAVRLQTITAPAALPSAVASSLANQPENKTEKQEVQASTSRSAVAMMSDRPQPPGPARPFPAVTGQVEWGRLGLRVASPSATVAEQLDLPRGTGLVVEEVLPGSPAAGAGVKVHDILLAIDGRSVPSSAAVRSGPPVNLRMGVPVDVVVLRKRRRELVHGLVVPQTEPDRRLAALLAGPPLLPGLVPPIQPRAGESVTTLVRAGDGFFAWHQENGVLITLAGTTSEGRCWINEIVVQAGGVTQKYQTVEQVPAAFRDEVKTLVGLSEQGSVRIEVRPS